MQLLLSMPDWEWFPRLYHDCWGRYLQHSGHATGCYGGELARDPSKFHVLMDCYQEYDKAAYELIPKDHLHTRRRRSASSAALYKTLCDRL